jgi:hypothetical protein
MKLINWQIIATASLFVMLTLLGCGKSGTGEKGITAGTEASIQDSAVVIGSEAIAANDNVTAEAITENDSVTAGTEASTDGYDVVSADENSSKALIDEFGIYDSKDEVALYIVTYDKLPSNYITKKEAKKLGWSGGSLENYAPGKCIGGDYFGNYEGNLPENAEYHECDIDTLGKKSRGAKRLVFSEDGYIYYTEDHYETFELLYEP